MRQMDFPKRLAEQCAFTGREYLDTDPPCLATLPLLPVPVRCGSLKVLRDYSAQTKGIFAFRKKALADKRIKQQQELFLKGIEIAKGK